MRDADLAALSITSTTCADLARARLTRGAASRTRYSSGMCIICVEVAKQAMTPAEGRRALREMTTKLGKEHAAEVEAKLREAEAGAAKP